MREDTKPLQKAGTYLKGKSSEKLAGQQLNLPEPSMIPGWNLG